MNRSFESKIIELKEKEAAKDFEINKIKKESELLNNEYHNYIHRND